MWPLKLFGNSRVVYALTIGVSAGLLGWFVFRQRRIFKPRVINIVTTTQLCDEVINELRRRCSKQGAVGFDCEWVTLQGRRCPVSLVQLSSCDGYSGLFRLNVMKEVPNSLKEFLQDSAIYKLGVGPVDDAKFLAVDYSVTVKGALDLRHIAQNSGFEPGGLDSLAKRHLGVTLDKNWRIRASDWNADALTDRQIMYAANDAYVAVKIFEKILQYDRSLSSWFRSDELVWKNIGQTCKRYSDLNFCAKSKNSSKNKEDKNSKKKKKYSVLTRSKPLYQNGLMLAPDGELLCTCDTKKAQWYTDKGLAELVSTEPYTIRLRFEPAGRAVGEVGRYYQQEKENRCVVCGADDSYIRKNVVPREYRKYFPDIMKDHSSHDVVLLCTRCHQRSNVSDQRIRSQLATQCDAPLSHAHESNQDKYIEDADAKKVRSAARALLQDQRHGHLPPPRRQELRRVVLTRYADREITDSLLSEAANVQILYENDSYESHGQRVVEQFTRDRGLLTLEKIWREHFLETMQPRCLPALWCVNHNEERLMIKVREGRLSPEDMKIIGLDTRLAE